MDFSPEPPSGAGYHNGKTEARIPPKAGSLFDTPMLSTEHRPAYHPSSLASKRVCTLSPAPCDVPSSHATRTPGQSSSHPRSKSTEPTNSAPDQNPLPPSPDLIQLVDFELPSELTAENAAYNEGETPARSTPRCHADLSVYGESVAERLRLEYEGDVKGKGEAQLYYDPTSDGVPLEKKLVQKAKRRFKLCRKYVDFLENAV